MAAGGEGEEEEKLDGWIGEAHREPQRQGFAAQDPIR